MARRSKAHPGFAAVAARAAAAARARGKPLTNPGAVIAESTRNASAKAKRRNPRLKRVKG